MINITAQNDVYSGKKNNLSKRLLLIDDHAVNRELLSEYLRLSGYEVLSLGDGFNFFQMIAAFQPDLILLDLKLPQPDGYTLLEQIKETSEWRHIPVIVVSAFAFEADQQRAMNLGARRYLVKPIHLHYLQQTIEEELQCSKF